MRPQELRPTSRRSRNAVDRIAASSKSMPPILTALAAAVTIPHWDWPDRRAPGLQGLLRLPNARRRAGRRSRSNSRPCQCRRRSAAMSRAGFLAATVALIVTTSQRVAAFATCPIASRVGSRWPGRRKLTEEAGCFGSDLASADVLRPSLARSRTAASLVSLSWSSPCAVSACICSH